LGLLALLPLLLFGGELLFIKNLYLKLMILRIEKTRTTKLFTAFSPLTH
jgi:hypothetical protein